MSKIKLLENGLQNILMSMYEERLKEHDEASAKKYITDVLSKSLRDFGKNDILIDGIQREISIRKVVYDIAKQEEDRLRIYNEIETLSSVLEILRRSSN